MRVRVFVLAASSLSIVLGAFACSNDDNANNPLPVYDPDAAVTHLDATLPDAGTPDTSAPDVVADTSSPDANDAGPVINVNGCTEPAFADADYSPPDADRLIRFPFDAMPGPYDPPCMRIKAGESVTWQGDFFFHPLMGTGNDSPIPMVSDAGRDATTYTVDFAEAGVFGFQCMVHGSMQGAIEVKP